jgi:hypothetical protein
MNYLKMITVVVISVLIYSCGASHHLIDESIYQNDDFTYNHLMNNEVIIAGISSSMIKFSNEERVEYSSMLSNRLLEGLEDVHKISFINTMQMIDKVGKQKYFEIMSMFDRGLILSGGDFHLISNSLPDTKYILVAFVKNENIIDRSFDEYIEEDEEKKRKTDYERTYLLTIDFQIYDIYREELVWSNVIYNEADRSESRTTRTGCFESCADTIIDNILFGSPAEISREEVFAKTIEKFTENLVRTKS